MRWQLLCTHWHVPLLVFLVQLGTAEQSSLQILASLPTGPARTMGGLDISIDKNTANMIARRQRAREEQDFATADGLMQQLFEMGLQVLDMPDGATNVERIQSKAEKNAVRAHHARAATTTTMRARARRNKKTNSHHRVCKARGPAFATWLVETFAEALQTQDEQSWGEVLDVAGGAGTLSWELAFEHGIRSTVIDPRPVRLSEGKTIAALRLARTYTPAPQLEHPTHALSRQVERAWLHPRPLRRLVQNEDTKTRVQKTCVMLRQSGMAQISCLFTESLFTTSLFTTSSDPRAVLAETGKHSQKSAH